MGEPPRGTYYPASPGTGNQPPRHYQFNATNPWEREEREKVMKCSVICLSVNLTRGAGRKLILCFVHPFVRVWFGLFLCISVTMWYYNSFETTARLLFAGKGMLTVCG
jgi:hypothetical protein